MTRNLGAAVTFKMLGDCKPMKQWEIMGEMRRRIKIRFDAEGIEIPFPHQTVYWGEAQPPFRGEATPDRAPSESEAEARITAPMSEVPEEPTVVSGDTEIITPERREELLAEIAMSAAARVGDADPDIRTRTMLIDTADSD